MRPAGGSWDATPAQLTAPGAHVAGRQVVIDSTGTAGKLLTDTRIYKTCGRPA